MRDLSALTLKETRTHKEEYLFAVMLLFATTVFVLSIVSMPAHAQVQVLKCTDEMPPISDDWLQRAVVKLNLAHHDISFQADDNPCHQATDTIKALNRTLGRNHLKDTSGYEFVKVINGEEYFTVERFKSKNQEDLQALATGLKENSSHKLKIESNTTYEYFLVSDTIVIMISSATGREANSKMFWEVRQAFASLETTK